MLRSFFFSKDSHSPRIAVLIAVCRRRRRRHTISRCELFRRISVTWLERFTSIWFGKSKKKKNKLISFKMSCNLLAPSSDFIFNLHIMFVERISFYCCFIRFMCWTWTQLFFVFCSSSFQYLSPLFCVAFAFHSWDSVFDMIWHTMRKRIRMAARSTHDDLDRSVPRSHLSHATKTARPKQTALILCTTKSHRKLIRSNAKIESFDSHYFNLYIPILPSLAFSLLGWPYGIVSFFERIATVFFLYVC